MANNPYRHLSPMGRPQLKITSDHYGSWALLHRAVGTRDVSWVCRCECGTVRTVKQYSLVNGTSQSCGCMRYGRPYEKGHRRPEFASTPEYTIWLYMKRRCVDPRDHTYGRYGGRGIRVCDRWMSFPSFLEDMGPRPSEEHSLDRIDNNGNYEPGNCRWADRITQARNARSNRSIIRSDGAQFETIAEAAELSGVNPHSLRKAAVNGYACAGFTWSLGGNRQ